MWYQHPTVAGGTTSLLKVGIWDTCRNMLLIVFGQQYNVCVLSFILANGGMCALSFLANGRMCARSYLANGRMCALSFLANGITCALSFSDSDLMLAFHHWCTSSAHHLWNFYLQCTLTTHPLCTGHRCLRNILPVAVISVDMYVNPQNAKQSERLQHSLSLHSMSCFSLLITLQVDVETKGSFTIDFKELQSSQGELSGSRRQEVKDVTPSTLNAGRPAWLEAVMCQKTWSWNCG